MTLLLAAFVVIAFAMVYAQLLLMVGSEAGSLIGALVGCPRQSEAGTGGAGGASRSRAFIRA